MRTLMDGEIICESCATSLNELDDRCCIECGCSVCEDCIDGDGICDDCNINY